MLFVMQVVLVIRYWIHGFIYTLWNRYEGNIDLAKFVTQGFLLFHFHSDRMPSVKELKCLNFMQFKMHEARMKVDDKNILSHVQTKIAF